MTREDCFRGGRESFSQMGPEPRLEEKEEPVQNGGRGCACRGGKSCCKRLRGMSPAGCVCSESPQVGPGLTWARGPGRRQGGVSQGLGGWQGVSQHFPRAPKAGCRRDSEGKRRRLEPG